MQSNNSSKRSLNITTEYEKALNSIAPNVRHGSELVEDSPDGSPEPDPPTNAHLVPPPNNRQVVTRLPHKLDSNDSVTRHTRDFSFAQEAARVAPLAGSLNSKFSDTEQVSQEDMATSFLGLRGTELDASPTPIRGKSKSSNYLPGRKLSKRSNKVEPQSARENKKYEKELKRALTRKPGKKQQMTSLYDLKRKATKKYKPEQEPEEIETLGPEQRTQYVKQKWLLAAQRGFLMGTIIVQFKEVNKRVQMFGTSRRVTIADPGKINQPVKKYRLIHPDNTIKRIWDIFIGVLLIYTAIMVPYRLAFEDDTPLGWFIWDLLLDVCFMLDIVLNFFTGYIDQQTGVLQMGCKKIARNYVKGWFFLDVIATFPFQLIELYAQTGGTRYNKLLRLLRLPRLYRLVRLFKCVKLMKMPSLKKCCSFLRINQAMKRLLIVAALVIFFSHLVTCMWYLIAKIDDFNADTWVSRKEVNNESTSFKYLMGFYWTIQTITTVGFGDIGSVTTLEMVMSLIWMIFGVGFYSYVIGNFSSMIAALDQKNQELRSRLLTLDKFQEQEKISDNLHRRIKLHIEQNVKQIDYIQMKNQLLEQLPPALKIDVMKHTNGQMIDSLRFFEGKVWNFIWTCIPKLMPINFTKFQVLYREGDVSSECFFIMKGAVAFCTPDARVFRKFFQGAHFAEYTLFTNSLRRETAVSETKCEFYVLPKTDFLDLIEQFPREARQLREEAERKDQVLTRARLAMMKKKKEEEVKPHPRIKAVLEKSAFGLQQVNTIQEQMAEQGWKNENQRVTQVYVDLIKRSHPRPIQRRHSTDLLSSERSFGDLTSQLTLKRSKSFSEFENKSKEIEKKAKQYNKTKTVPASMMKQSDNEKEDQKPVIMQQYHANTLSQEEYLFGKKGGHKTRRLQQKDYNEADLQRERELLKRRETHLIEEITKRGKIEGPLDHAPSLMIPVNLEAIDNEIQQSQVLKVVKQFNQSVKLLTSSSFSIFSTLNKLQNEADIHRNKVKSSLNAIIHKQRALQERLAKEK